MKNNKLSIAALICSVLILSSCEKESVHPSGIDQYSTEKQQKKDKGGGGEEEEWIIIEGVVENSSTSTAISGAEVVLYDENFTTPFDTVLSNSLGEFEFQNDSGIYAFKVSASGYHTLMSDSYDFPDSNPITLSLQAQ